MWMGRIGMGSEVCGREFARRGVLGPCLGLPCEIGGRDGKWVQWVDMARHRILEEATRVEEGGEVVIVGDEAQHAARVKRLGRGDVIEILDGRGGIGTAMIEEVGRTSTGGRQSEWILRARVEGVMRVAPTTPRVEVWSAAPKGSRLAEMIEGLSQVGCALWRPLLCERTVVEPREGKMERLDRVARESAKQCGRPWIMEIGEPVELRGVVRALGEMGQGGDAQGRVLVADGSGVALWKLAIDGASSPATAHDVVRLLVGPEGGFSEREVSMMHEVGIERVALGAHIMRIETAAVVGAAMLGALFG